MKLRAWQIVYVIGMAIVGFIFVSELLSLHLPEFVAAIAELIGGVMIIAGACEAFVLSVEGISQNMHMTDYVSGIYASLASTIPELSVLTFLILGGEYEMAWVLALATIFMNTLVFAVYSLILPKDKDGNFRLPAAIMWVGSDLLSMGAVISLSVGLSMLLLFVFSITDSSFPQYLEGTELWLFGFCLLAVFIAYLYNITKYHGKCDPESDDRAIACAVEHEQISKQNLVIYLVLASLGALVGGEALSSFATFARETIELGFIQTALLLVLFSGTPEYIIVATSHYRDEIEVALSNAFGGIVQVFFVVFSYTLIVAGFVGGIIPIDVFSLVLLFFAFPSLFILRVMITDDSKINNLEAIAMIAVFIMMLYMLLVFGTVGTH